jgi:hypothetical protein
MLRHYSFRLQFLVSALPSIYFQQDFSSRVIFAEQSYGIVLVSRFPVELLASPNNGYWLCNPKKLTLAPSLKVEIRY